MTGPLAGQNTNFNGQIGDRPHQFKLTGTYMTPFWDIGLAGNFNSQSGIADHAPGLGRADGRRQQHGQRRAARVVPAAAPHRGGPARLQERQLRRAQRSKCRWTSTTSATTNTVWDARTLSGTINLRQNGDPAGAINTVPQFGSPAQVYGPRNIRFNVAFRF